MSQDVNRKRIRILNKTTFSKTGAVTYWMSRDQRVEDNWALLFARECAQQYNLPLLVIFTFDPQYPSANFRHFDFMIKGLQQVEKQLSNSNISLFVRTGNSVELILHAIKEFKISCLVTDFDPLNIKQSWKQAVAKKISIPFYAVDTHNIVPCHVASDKEEYGAYTLRLKIRKLLHEFLTDFPVLEAQKTNPFKGNLNDWLTITESISQDKSVLPVPGIEPGSDAALNKMQLFIGKKIRNYNSLKNDPNQDVLSGLSPYLHFGHISAQRIAREVIREYKDDENAASFLEELIVRKELADNFCFYNANYSNLKGAREWARNTLHIHRQDKRDIVYSKDDFENAKIHEPLWNAAQNEMKKTGKMHGYMRIYWAKKILEWSADPETALDIAITLNDKYSLDGRDPNGYVGCLWSIAGIHDRPWAERSVFGKIRYMNEKGCRRKFDVDAYIQAVDQIQN